MSQDIGDDSKGDIVFQQVCCQTVPQGMQAVPLRFFELYARQLLPVPDNVVQTRVLAERSYRRPRCNRSPTTPYFGVNGGAV